VGAQCRIPHAHRRAGNPYIKYQASSPDEYALIVAAKACGVVFKVPYPSDRTDSGDASWLTNGPGVAP